MSVFPDISWGFPAANFPFYPDLCDYEQHFDAHQIVFDLTLCVSVLSTTVLSTAETLIFSKGDRVDAVWSTSGCKAETCQDCKTFLETPISRLTDTLSPVVDNNPSAFAEAYWEINSLRVYTPPPQ
jgi:hypothetical protein